MCNADASSTMISHANKASIVHCTYPSIDWTTQHMFCLPIYHYTDCYTAVSICFACTKTFSIEKAYCWWLVRYFYFVAYAQCAIDAFDHSHSYLDSYDRFWLSAVVHPICRQASAEVKSYTVAQWVLWRKRQNKKNYESFSSLRHFEKVLVTYYLQNTFWEPAILLNSGRHMRCFWKHWEYIKYVYRFFNVFKSPLDCWTRVPDCPQWAKNI